MQVLKGVFEKFLFTERSLWVCIDSWHPYHKNQIAILPYLLKSLPQTFVILTIRKPLNCQWKSSSATNYLALLSIGRHGVSLPGLAKEFSVDGLIGGALGGSGGGGANPGPPPTPPPISKLWWNFSFAVCLSLQPLGVASVAACPGPLAMTSPSPWVAADVFGEDVLL